MDQVIVQRHLVLILILTAVINHLLEMNIFVDLEFLVEKMKGTVIPMMNVTTINFVDIKTVQTHLVLPPI